MPRKARLLLSKSYYHIITRGNNKNRVFRTARDYKKYLYLINKYKEEHPFHLYHYCLMPNHVHMLVKTNKSTDFSTFMKKLNLTYFFHYKKAYGWVGHFWQDRFFSQPVGTDTYFMQCGKYIELNPLRAKLVNNLTNYAYSSFNYYARGANDKLITPDAFYKKLDPNPIKRMVKYNKLVIDDDITNSYKKKIWGSSEQRYNEARKIKYNLKNYQKRG